MQKLHRIVAGDSADLYVPLLQDGTQRSIAGWRCWFTARALPGEEPAIAKSTETGGIVMQDATSWRVEFAPADTKALPPGRYHYDLQASPPSGRIETLERGTLIIDPEITTQE